MPTLMTLRVLTPAKMKKRLKMEAMLEQMP
jgi:hypothetical protein